MTSIFLSYRRADVSGYAGRLAMDLRARFGDDQVFQDIQTIQPGTDFRDSIDAALRRCEVALVLIGNTWLSECDAAGLRRLDDPADFVRLEIGTALRRHIPVLPVLVENARMPAEDDLPRELKALAHRQGLELSDVRWDYDFSRLADAIEALTRRRPRLKRWVWSGLLALAAAGLAGGTYYLVTQPADVAGRWQLPNGSVWLIEQDGEEIRIDEVHYQSKEIWKRGRGRVDGKQLRFSLELVYQRGGPSYRGEAYLVDDGRLIRGEIADQSTGRREAVVLTR